MPNPTHRYVERPQLGLRYLADYMAGSKRRERSILQSSKYRPIAKIVQHQEAQSTVSKFIRGAGALGADWLEHEAQRLRNRIADDDFERLVLDINADYIARFAVVALNLVLPNATILPPGRPSSIDIDGVKISVGFHLRFQRTTKTNKVREGAAMLRYAKGKPLPAETGAWQSAFILGYLEDVSSDRTIEPEGKLW